MNGLLKAILARFSRSRSVGLAIDDERVTVGRVIHTPLGPVELGTETTPVGNDTIDVALRTALKPILESKEWRRAPVVVGLPALRLLFTARPFPAGGREVTGQSLLHEALQLTNILIDDLAIDMHRSQVGKRSTASIVATRKRYLEPLLESLTSEGVQPHAVEPAAFGLLRLAVSRHGIPRRARAAVRVFLGSTSGLAILAIGDQPLSWRAFALPASSSGEAVGPLLVAVVGAVRHMAGRLGFDEPPDQVIVHGRPDLAGLEGFPAWEAAGVTVQRHASPGLDDAEAATGSAFACHRDDEGFNLAPQLRPQLSLLSLFPWGQAAVAAAILAGATSLLAGQMFELQTQAEMVRARAERFSWLAGRSIDDLEKEKSDETLRVEAVRAFLTTRFQWTNLAREIGSQMPSSMSIKTFSGSCPLPADAKGKESGRKMLVLEVETPVSADGDVPPDIHAMLENMRGNPLLKKWLPVIRMSGLKWGLDRGTNATRASFNLTCEPVGSGKGKKS